MPETITTSRLQRATPVFLVGDIAATMQWYRDALGFEGRAVPDTPPHDFAILRRDEVVLFFQQLSGYEKPDVYRRREGGVWSAYVRTAGVRPLYQTLTARSDVTIVQPLRRQPYGQIEFEVRDPNGYVLVFAEEG